MDALILEMKNISKEFPGVKALNNVSFRVKKGEIVGFAGLMGSGRTELALSKFGNPGQYQMAGEMYIRGEKKQFHHPKECINAGMSIIMISSELPETLGMSDRVYIVSSGRLSGELPIEEATQKK